MKEADVIAALSRIHGTRAYEADAEIVPFAGTNLLLSTDSFSEREDFLSNLGPEAMGRVMAYGSVSDILACGAKPEGLVQAWNLDEAHDESFYSRVARGVQDVVEHYGAKVVGGDMGTAREWCWTGTAFASSDAPVRRIASRRIDFDLYATGAFGAANAAVFLGKQIPVPQFRPPVSREALFATDSSGGFIDALENFRRVNPGMWLEVDGDNAIADEVKSGLPEGVESGWALVGGVGEYELLFGVPFGMDVPGCLKIGHGGFASEGEFRLLFRGRTGILHEPPLDYRAITTGEWLNATAAYWERMGF